MDTFEELVLISALLSHIPYIQLNSIKIPSTIELQLQYSLIEEQVQIASLKAAFHRLSF